MADDRIDWDADTSDDFDETTSDNFPDLEDENFFADDDLSPEDDFVNAKKSNSGIQIGYKGTIFIVVGVLVVLSVVLMFVDNIKIQKKPVPTTPITNKEQVESSGDVGDYGDTGSDSEVVNDSKKSEEGTLTEVASDEILDYAGDELKANGTIHNKVRYLQNNTIVYCIQISANIGGNQKLIPYYCGYNVYNSVTAVDEVQLSYKIVSRNTYSISTISK